MKPVELYVNAYLNNSDSGDVTFEPYAGSGTAFIASEQTGRECRGIEIDPAYCDVIVERWGKFTGKKARLSNEQPVSTSRSRSGILALAVNLYQSCDFRCTYCFTRTTSPAFRGAIASMPQSNRVTESCNGHSKPIF